MTVQELRDWLADLPDDRRVLVARYESGYTEPRLVADRVVEAVEPEGHWEGEWKSPADSYGLDADGPTEIAAVIGR